MITVSAGCKLLIKLNQSLDEDVIRDVFVLYMHEDLLYVLFLQSSDTMWIDKQDITLIDGWKQAVPLSDIDLNDLPDDSTFAALLPSDHVQGDIPFGVMDISTCPESDELVVLCDPTYSRPPRVAFTETVFIPKDHADRLKKNHVH